MLKEGRIAITSSTLIHCALLILLCSSFLPSEINYIIPKIAVVKVYMVRIICGIYV
jgi:hypothetical protein